MEPRFGQDFSGVWVHTDARAAESATAVRAHAYTSGSHIVFAQGAFAPTSVTGKHLLAHELCHVVQQSGAPSLQRQEAEPEPAPETTIAPDTSVADELRALADQAESGSSGTDDPAMSEKITAFASRLRAVAGSNDPHEQARVLSAFTTAALSRIEQKASEMSGPSPTVADHASAGARITIRETAPPIVQRQGAEAVLEGLIAFEAAGGAEAEVATGPPGWVVGGLILLAIGGLVIVTMARPRVGTCSCQHRDVFTSGGVSCLTLRTSERFERVYPTKQQCGNADWVCARHAADRACVEWDRLTGGR